MSDQTPQQRRQTALLRTVIENIGIEIDDLAVRLGVSVVTVYRDIAKLEAEGVVKLERGTVIPLASSVYEVSSSMRAGLEQEQKASLAPALAGLVGRGATIMVDDSSSVLPGLEMLAENAYLSIVTNSLAVVDRVGKVSNIEIHCVGGKFYPWSNAFYGPKTIDAIREYQADYCIMSEAAIYGENLLSPFDYVSATKRAMIDACRTCILMVDHTKFGRKALIKTGTLGEFDYIITDEDPGAEYRSICDEGNVQLIVTGR